MLTLERKRYVAIYCVSRLKSFQRRMGTSRKQHLRSLGWKAKKGLHASYEKSEGNTGSAFGLTRRRLEVKTEDNGEDSSWVLQGKYWDAREQQNWQHWPDMPYVMRNVWYLLVPS